MQNKIQNIFSIIRGRGSRIVVG